MVKRTNTFRYTSEQIRRLYRKRSCRRNHAMSALARDLFERSAQLGVSTVYVGDLTGVLDAHWSVEANAKAHNFWAHRTFINRFEDTAEEYGITVEERDEAWTSQACPECGEREETIRPKRRSGVHVVVRKSSFRDDERLRLSNHYEAHADLDASRLFLENQTGTEVGSMA